MRHGDEGEGGGRRSSVVTASNLLLALPSCIISEAEGKNGIWYVSIAILFLLLLSCDFSSRISRLESNSKYYRKKWFMPADKLGGDELDFGTKREEQQEETIGF